MDRDEFKRLLEKVSPLIERQNTKLRSSISRYIYIFIASLHYNLTKYNWRSFPHKRCHNMFSELDYTGSDFHTVPNPTNAQPHVMRQKKLAGLPNVREWDHFLTTREGKMWYIFRLMHFLKI